MTDRTIRDVKEGDVVVAGNFELKVDDVGEKGFVDFRGDYILFSEAERFGYKLKQPEKQEIEKLEAPVGDSGYDSYQTKKLNEVIEVVNECKQQKANVNSNVKQEIEIAEEINGDYAIGSEGIIVKNRKLIIELQKVVNKLVKDKV